MGNELPKEHLTQADADIINATSWEDLHPEWIDDGDLTRHFSKTQFADCPACGKFEQLEVMNTTYDDPGSMVFCRPCQFGASGETPSEAIENWNRRAEPTRTDATAALVKAARNINGANWGVRKDPNGTWHCWHDVWEGGQEGGFVSAQDAFEKLKEQLNGGGWAAALEAIEAAIAGEEGKENGSD